MRPSISVSLDPGLERGVPWGRDLYTFVTSAAGHMMRTLQKPRKNRPSKRQVNHRRFLHNMIQRKFADIEAANHRLASAIYFQDDEKNTPSLSSHKPDTPEQPGNQREDEVCSESGDLVKSIESYEKKHQHQQEVQFSTCSAQMNNQSQSGQREEPDPNLAHSTFTRGTEDHRSPETFGSDCLSENSTCKSMNNLSDDTQMSLKESGFKQFDQNVDISMCFSPELSPLSLDSYDFSLQGPVDKTACLQNQRNLTDISEGQLNDIMDFLCVDGEDFVGCTDLETYLDSMCACDGGAGPENEADDVTYVGQSASITEALLCDQGESAYIYRHSCPEDQVASINQSNQQKLRSSAFTPEEQLYSSGNLLHTSAARPCGTQLHMSAHTQEKSTCMLLTSDPNPNFTPFEGVAQSFSVPSHNPENRPIPTPPHEDDWLFTDILKDRKSLDFA